MPKRPPFERAWISGASSGLGRAIAIELGRHGAFVHLFARSRDGLEETLNGIRSVGGEGQIHQGDVTDSERLGESIRSADQSHPGGLDLAIAGAGIAETGFDGSVPTHEVTARILDVNFTAAVRTVELARALMGPRGRGALCAISSLAGLRTMGAAPAYSTSKSALIAYLRAIRCGAAAEGLRVVDIQPGFVRTPMTDRNRFRMPFLLEPEDAARRSVNGLRRGAPVVAYPRRLAWPTKLCAKAAPEWIWQQITGTY